MAIQTINPVNGELVKDFNEMTTEDVTKIIDDTHEAWLSWREKGYDARSKYMLRAAEVLRDDAQKWAEIMTLEMGKPISQSKSEVEKCAWVCEYYAINTSKILAKEIIETDGSKSYVRFDPIGVVLAVMPWNFPYWQVFRFAAPALMAGNVGLLKHASNVPQSALAIEEMFKQAGFPENTFRTLLIGSGKVNDVLDHPKVRAATLTGSEPAGRSIAAEAGKRLKKTVLELGGSDPFVVFEDADLDEAVPMGVKSRLVNNGQSCIAAKRFIVVDAIADEFEKRFVEEIKKINYGDPMDENTEQGPMARKDLMEELHEQVQRSVEKGAKVIVGGKPMERGGAYYEPTVLTNVTPETPAYHEELFGPVAIIIRAKDEDDAIRIANDSDFGLGGSVWTQDTEKGENAAARIESGAVFVNGLMRSDPRLPFGGVKISGYGRELSTYGIKEFVNIKSVWVK